MNVLVRPWRYWSGGALWGVVWLVLLAGSIALSVLAAQHDRLPGDLDLTQRPQDPTVPRPAVAQFAHRPAQRRALDPPQHGAGPAAMERPSRHEAR